MTLEAMYGLVVLVLGIFLGSYIRRKGELFATKEGIGIITRIEEEVRHQFRQIIEQGTRTHQLRLAALDRRLQAHQEAYALWRELISNAHQRDKIGAVVMKCQEWFCHNCLYLDADARQAFAEAYGAAFIHSEYTRGRQDDEDRKRVESNWNRIEKAGDAIVKGVELPSIGKSEADLKEIKLP
ncbi:MAG: hypothetical protein ABSA97_07685 [Verrucomicrobiia bacterium]